MKSRIPTNTARSGNRILACLMALCLGSPLAHGIIGEPETVVYGRILNHVNPNAEELVVEGDLLWSIQKPDGSVIQLAGAVEELAGGTYSYTLRIPHQAVMLGEDPAEQTVPLGTSISTAYHMGISVGGDPALILPPATAGFDLDQLLRASAVRVDLAINAEGLDSDGDGIPDWWEDENGLDKQDASDALTDLNNNGRNNLAEYLAGFDPNRDSTQPLLLTREVIAYADSSSLVPLEVQDSDSHPEQLAFTIYSLPDGGELRLRNSQELPAETVDVLTVGSNFTLADIRSGRLVFHHSGADSSGSFDVGVRDEDPSHDESRGEVSIRMFVSESDSLAVNSSEKVRFQSHRLARDLGHLVVDFGSTAGSHTQSAPSAGLSELEYEAHMESFGADSPHIMLGGPAADVFSGGAANDFLLGDQGADSLTGGPGADSFLFIKTSPDVDVISDFSPEEGDVIDLAAVLDGSSTLLTDYVRIRRSGADALLEVSSNGAGVGYGDLVIRLENSPLSSGDLVGLFYGGNLEAGDIGLPPRIGVIAGQSASENGPVDGGFVITREGDLNFEVTASLQLSGNATNGSDYEFISSTVILPAGMSSVEVAVRPYVDANVEFDEVVHLALLGSANYLLANSSAAQITIEDLKPQLSLEVLQPLASVEEGIPGSVLMRRDGLISSDVFVQFDLDGTAVNGTDYNYITPFVNFSPGQRTKLVQFTPKPSADFDGMEAKTIQMSLKADVSYAMPVPMASLMMVPLRLTYGSWLAENGLSDSGEEGAALLIRYAFALDPLVSTDPLMLTRLPKADLQDDHLTISFRRKPGISDYRYQVEYTNDLVNWTTGPEVVEDISFQVSPTDPGAAVFRAKRPISDAEKAVMRVNIVPNN